MRALVGIGFAFVFACSKAAPPEPRAAPASPTRAPDAGWLPPGGSPPPPGVVVPAIGRAIEARREDPTAANVWYGKFEIDPKHPRVVKYHAELARQGVSPPADGEIGKELYLEQVTGAPLGKDSYLTPDGKLSVLVKGSVDSDTDHFFELFVGPPGG